MNRFKAPIFQASQKDTSIYEHFDLYAVIHPVGKSSDYYEEAERELRGQMSKALQRGSCDAILDLSNTSNEWMVLIEDLDGC